MKQLTMNLDTERHAWGNLSNLTTALIWAKYGYWHEGYGPPEWYDDELNLAETIAGIVQPPDVRYKVTFNSVTHAETEGDFRCWDEANKWVEPWAVGFRFKSKESALQNYQREYLNHKHLHEGVINALLHYKNTGEPVEPDWLPQGKTNFHWLRKEYKPENYTGFRRIVRSKK